MWASYPKAWQLVLEKWKVQDHGSEASKLHRKCQRLLRAFFFWSISKFEKLNQLKEALDSEICMLQEL